MAKEIKFNIEARDLLKKGVDELANAVKVTLALKVATLFYPNRTELRTLPKTV